MKIKLNKKAFDHLAEQLPDDTVRLIMGLSYRHVIGNYSKGKAINIILSNPHIYGMVLIDWMQSRGRFENLQKSMLEQIEDVCSDKTADKNKVDWFSHESGVLLSVNQALMLLSLLNIETFCKLITKFAKKNLKQKRNNGNTS